MLADIKPDTLLAENEEWRAVELAGRDILNGTSITIGFDRNGRVSGDAGANNYMGQYERVGSEDLKISNLTTTRKYLDIPPGRMQQERAYVEALRSIDRFTIEDGELVLWTGPTPSLRFVRAR